MSLSIQRGITPCQNVEIPWDPFCFPHFFIKFPTRFARGCEIYEHRLSQLTYHDALCRSASLGNVFMIKYIVGLKGKELLNLGTNKYGFTPLFFAALADKQRVVDLMIEMGADVNVGSKIGQTGLWCAAQKTKSISMVKLLLRYGAIAPTILDTTSQTLVARAQQELDREKKATRMTIGVHTHFNFDHEANRIIGEYLWLDIQMNSKVGIKR